MGSSDSPTRTWLIVAGLALGTAISNGFARFAYGLILPAMRDDLGWTYTQAGWINTANAIGYLAGALLGLAMINRLGAARLFNVGMVFIALALFCSGLTRDFWLLTFWRVVAGIGGAPVFIAAGALASALFTDHPSRNALAIAVCLAGGGGAGMFLSGVAIPVVLERWTVSAWPQVWMLLGVASAVAIWPSWLATRSLHSPAGQKETDSLDWSSVRPVMPALLSYGLFGVGYIVYLTFLVAWMKNQGAQPLLVALTWAVISIMVIASPFIWRSVLARAQKGGALFLACLTSGVAVFLPLLLPTTVGIVLSAALFGGSFFIAPTAATSFSRKRFPASQWGGAMALFTVVFAAGQIIGPVAAGALADSMGDVTPGLVFAGAVLLLSAITALMQRAVRS